MLLQACPQGIQVAALILEEKPFAKTTTPPLLSQQWQSSLYQPAAGGGWVQCYEIWYDTTVLAPPKQFNGPVGRY
jgi:hypothetical protein